MKLLQKHVFLAVFAICLLPIHDASAEQCTTSFDLVCPEGQLMRGISENGEKICQTIPSSIPDVLSGDGHLKIGETIIKWGRVKITPADSFDNTQQISFPDAFPSAVHSLQVTFEKTRPGRESRAVMTQNVTATGFKLTLDRHDPSIYSYLHWVAIGE